jgi:PAS domain S-box-containing protein
VFKLVQARGENLITKTPLGKLVIIFALTGVYFCAGKLGLSVAYEHASVSAVWPPSGIALASLLVWGYRVWPGIFLGAFLVSITTPGSVATALGIAAGNTLEALLDAWVINRFANGARAFERAKTTFIFVLLGPILSSVVSATTGVISLITGGLARSDEASPIWFTWWVGDAVGDLIIAPLLLLWITQPRPRLTRSQIAEAGALLGSLILATYVLFILEVALVSEYVMVLPLLWAAFRFGQRGAVTAAFIMSAMASIGTINGVGPFTHVNPNQSLLNLQVFMGTVAIAALALAAAISETRRAEQRLEIQDAVSRILAESPALKEAAPKVIQVLCERAGWDLGAVWNIDPITSELCSVDVWHMPSIHAPPFVTVTEQSRFARGTGLPARVWNTGQPVWIPDVTVDKKFKRAPAALEDGLRSGFCVPIKLANGTRGVIECFSREIRQPDHNFLQMVSGIGVQLGQFFERKRAEDLLMHSEERLRAMIETAVDGIITIDEGGIITSANPAAERIFGYSAAEAIGRHVNTLIPDACRRDRDFELRVPREVRGRRSDGTTLPLELTVSETSLGDRQIFTSIVRDITKRKLAEELLRQAKAQLLQANEELEKRVQERTADLRLANTALLRTIDEQKKLQEQLRQAQKMEIIGTLAGGIAHDFNNILNIIQGYAGILSLEHAGEQHTSSNFKMIDQQIKRGASLVRQLLTVARKTETHLVAIDANKFILSISELIKQAFPKNITIMLDLAPELPLVMADPNQLSQALLNISVNARDAMPAGGTLTIRTTVMGSDGQGDPRFEANSPYVSIEISDTGIGMEEDVRSRIFEPFFTTKGVGQGTGLGLAMVYGIIKEHNGYIDVESQPGHGTMLRVYLPVRDGREIWLVDDATAGRAITEKYLNGWGTVLVVEDEQAMARLLNDVFTEAGFRILTAMDGEQAVDLYLHHKEEIDVVVLDLGLPKITGFEVIDKLNQENRDVNIVITSGYLEPEVKAELFGAGVKDCFHKPYVVWDLIKKVGSLVEHSRTSRLV